MSLELGYGVKVLNPVPLDEKYLNENLAYASLAEANSLIPIGIRSPYLTIVVQGEEYWWKDGAWVVKLPNLANKADLVDGKVPESQLPTLGVTDHNLLSNIGTNTHAQIDTHIANVNNPHSVTKAQVGLGNVDNTSDLLKPISTATRNLLTNGDEFYIDLNDILRLNVSTYRQVEIATQNNQTFTLDFEPTFIISVIKDGIYLLQNQYIYTTPNQLQVLENVIGETIEITYEKFINEPTVL